MSKYVERFQTPERVLHWIVTVSFFTLLLSGVGLYSRLFTGYFNMFGGGVNAILAHKTAGVIFFLSSICLFLKHLKDVSRFDEDDKEWFKTQGGYFSKGEPHFNVGKYNPGQKVFALFIGIATLILGATGLFIWFPLTFPRWLVQISLMTHGLLFVGSVMFVIVHIYLATIGNPGTIDAMLYGTVRRKWAMKHHPKWYKEVSGGE